VGAFWPFDSRPSSDLTLALTRVDAPSAHQSCPPLLLLVSSWAFHGCSRSNAASTAMDQRISLYLASRVRFAGLPNAQPALDSTSREKWYQHRPTAAYRLGLGFGRSDKLRSRAAVQLKGAGKSLREKPAAIVAFGIADLPLQPVLQKPPGATNSPTNSADEAKRFFRTICGRFAVVLSGWDELPTASAGLSS